MKNARATWAIVAGLVAGCGEEPAELRAGEGAEGTPLEHQVPPTIDGTLFGLETREHRLYLLRSDAGKRYTVTTKDGTVVAADIDAAALARDFPELAELLRSGVDAVGTGGEEDGG